MITKFAGDPVNSTDPIRIAEILEYLLQKGLTGTVLDIGQRSPLTDNIADKFNVLICNTAGDLDEAFTFPDYRYDSIIYSHTIEHQFSPLHTLVKLKMAMQPHTRLFIILPSRTKLLWTLEHYHEIDRYRMQMLIERAGLQIVSYERRKRSRRWYSYLTGIRPFMRLFLEYNAYYEIKLKT
jgi:hypothetical protein